MAAGIYDIVIEQGTTQERFNHVLNKARLDALAEGTEGKEQGIAEAEQAISTIEHAIDTTLEAFAPEESS